MKVTDLSSHVALASLLVVPAASHSIQHMKRQVSCTDIGYYFKLVNTALFSVNYMQNYAHPCDLDLVPYFDAQGLVGAYAVDLICLYDAGTPIFNQPLSVVNDNLIVTLIGLFDAASSDNDPSRSLSCANVNTSILDDIELDSALIKNIICDYSPCTTGTSSSSTPSSSSVPSSSSTVSSSGMVTSSVDSGTGSFSSSMITGSTSSVSSSVSGIASSLVPGSSSGFSSSGSISNSVMTSASSGVSIGSSSISGSLSSSIVTTSSIPALPSSSGYYYM